MDSDPNFCKDVFCPAANSAWPRTLVEVCRPYLFPEMFGHIHGDPQHPLSSSVTSFCARFKSNVEAELPGHENDTAQPTVSDLYESMSKKCRKVGCLQESWACLAPLSYCEKVGNEKDAIQAGVAYDAGGVDTSALLSKHQQLVTYPDEHSCNDFCLKSSSGGLDLL